MKKNNKQYFLEPGHIFVSEQPYLISTVLGSCVSVCLWDSVRKAGGINHYMWSQSKGNNNARYGDVATKHLIRLLLELGCHPSTLKAHIVGGGCNPELSSTIGESNVAIAEEILQTFGIKIITRDVGGQTGRKLIFDNLSGEILVYKGINVRKNDWYT